MLIAIKLLGFNVFPAVQKDLVNGALEVSLPEDATVESLLSQLADKYGSMFTPRKPGGLRAFTRLLVFLDNEALDDPQTRLADKLRPQSAISITLVRPVAGG
jgi:hypothetical protein